MSSIQFKGIDVVLEAYESRNVAAWSLWQGRQFLFKYEGDNVTEGANELHSILDKLKHSTNAIYTLKVYEDLGKGGKIKNNTPDDGSFNFKLNFDEQEISSQQYGSLRRQDKLEQDIAELKQMILERDNEEEEDEPHRLGVIGEILNDPGISQILQPLIQPFLSKILGLGSTPAQTPMRSISGINDDTRSTNTANDDAAATLNEAIKILKEADPKLPEHLMKLATLSKESPDSFNFLLQTLDGM